MALDLVVERKRNFDAFQGLLPSLLPKHVGEFALLHARELVGVFPTPIDAVNEGYHRFGDEPFSIQRVIDRPVDLGFISYATGDGDIG